MRQNVPSRRSAKSARGRRLVLIALVVVGCGGPAPAPTPTHPQNQPPTQSPGPATAPPPTSSSPPPTSQIPSPTALPSAGASAAPSPRPSLADPAAVAFLELFAGGSPPFHVVLDTTLSGTTEGSARLEGDAAGADYRADLVVRLAGQPEQDSQVVVVDGTGFLAEAGSTTWRRLPDYEAVPPLNPFLDFEQLDWRAVGPDGDVGGAYRLRAFGWSMPINFLRQPVLREVVFHVWLDPTGQPVAAELAFQLVGIAADGASVLYGYLGRYSFSQVGVPVEIVAPVAGVP